MRSQLINPHHCSSIHARLTVGSRPLWKSDKKKILFYFNLTFDVQHHKSSMMMRNAWAHGLLGKIAFRLCGRMKLIRKGSPPPPGQVLQVERNTEVCLFTFVAHSFMFCEQSSTSVHRENRADSLAASETQSVLRFTVLPSSPVRNIGTPCRSCNHRSGTRILLLLWVFVVHVFFFYFLFCLRNAK